MRPHRRLPPRRGRPTQGVVRASRWSRIKGHFSRHRKKYAAVGLGLGALGLGWLLSRKPTLPPVHEPGIRRPRVETPYTPRFPEPLTGLEPGRIPTPREPESRKPNERPTDGRVFPPLHPSRYARDPGPPRRGMDKEPDA
jgi:hypothetical protein